MLPILPSSLYSSSRSTMSELVHIQASYISLFTVAFLLVVARVFVKVKIVHNLGLEDYACIFALVHYDPNRYNFVNLGQSDANNDTKVCAINSTYFFCRGQYQLPNSFFQYIKCLSYLTLEQRHP